MGMVFLFFEIGCFGDAFTDKVNPTKLLSLGTTPFPAMVLSLLADGC
jgi:hypothetical protein